MMSAAIAAFSAVPSTDSVKPVVPVVQTVTVDGVPMHWRPGEALRLPSVSERVVFRYGAAAHTGHVRLRYKLEGVDSTWKEHRGEMFLSVRFLDESGEQVARKTWNVSDDSPGWNGELTTATLSHRREMLTVPPGASCLQISISSAGPPSTLGIYAVDDLVVSRMATMAGSNVVLLRSPLGHNTCEPNGTTNLAGWVRNGTKPSMAQVVEIGRNPSVKALAILDDDANGHADWDSPKNDPPKVTPGEQLLLEWNEVYSMGLAYDDNAFYEILPEGKFRFCLSELTVLGVPTGARTSLEVRVPPLIWKTTWFWAIVALLFVMISAATGRYISWRRMQIRMLRLNQERLVEQERLRIARDIHDDLGARITQISLLSGLAQNDVQLPDKARQTFDTISRMSRDLVSALYETVWTVSPENDHLEALGTYLCQMVDQLCQQARLCCRFHVVDLPPDVQISSHARHQITLAVKEAVNNVIKHAQAAELTLRMELSGQLLKISIEDDGRGFHSDRVSKGNGLSNMQRRLSDIGGTCAIRRGIERGTIVEFHLPTGGAGLMHAGSKGDTTAPEDSTQQKAQT